MDKENVEHLHIRVLLIGTRKKQWHLEIFPIYVNWESTNKSGLEIHWISNNNCFHGKMSLLEVGAGF